MPVENDVIEVVVCLGSSCFARGNSENLELLKNFESQDASGLLRLTGSLCQDQCKQSPNLRIGGESHHSIHAAQLGELLVKLRETHGTA